MAQPRKQLLADFQSVLDIQLAAGNWDYDPYMHGMANGMIMMDSMARNPTKSPDYKTAPEYWIARMPRLRQVLKKWGVFIGWAIANFVNILTGIEYEFEIIYARPAVASEDA